MIARVSPGSFVSKYEYDAIARRRMPETRDSGPISRTSSSKPRSRYAYNVSGCTGLYTASPATATAYYEYDPFGNIVVQV